MNSPLRDIRTVLVTGGAGFVGSSLVPELLRSTSASVFVLDNLCNGQRGRLPVSDRLTFAEVDLSDAAAVAHVVTELQPDWVFHLAALHFIPYCNAHPAETLQVNVVGTQHLLDACREHPPAALVAVSSMAVYPIRDGANAETDPAGPTDVYGLSKWANEQQVALFSAQVPTRCVVARLSNVYGPRETNPHVVPAILEQVGRGQTDVELGNVKPRRDYVYVTDVAEALLALAAKNESPYRVFNVGAGEEYSVEEIVERLARVSGLPLKIRVASDRVRATDRMHLLCDLTRITREIGWRPRHDLQSGLAALWEWFAPQAARHQTALLAR
jgi:UDP-glucose 4-epimerase